MSKMNHLITNIQKLPSGGGSRLQRPLTFNIGDLKFRNFAKLCFSSWLWPKRTSKLVMKSFQWRHHHYFTEKQHQN